MTNMKGYDAFERSLRESVGSYEVPYNSADWSQLERRLEQGTGTSRSLSAGLYALLLGGALVAASTFFVLLDHTEEHAGGGAVEHAAAVLPAEIPSSTGTQEPEAGTAVAVAAQENEEVKVTPSSAGTNAPNGKPAPKQVVASVEALPEVVKKTASSSMEVAIRPSITEGCPGTTVSFDAQNLPEGGIYLWNFGDGSFSNKPSPSHTFSKSGAFEVMLSHSSMGGGNISNKPASDRIVIHEVPEASFNFLKQEYEQKVPSVHFENRSLGGQSYHWDFGDGSTSRTPHPDHVYKQKGAYHVTLTVTNAKGCTDRTERTVRIDSDYNLMAPKTFSPNSDGVEDTFMPEALRTLGVKFHLTIHDATSGQLVFETNDAQRSWNGRIQGKGEACSPGEYVWMVEMKDGEKLGGTYNGSVSLLR